MSGAITWIIWVVLFALVLFYKFNKNNINSKLGLESTGSKDTIKKLVKPTSLTWKIFFTVIVIFAIISIIQPMVFFLPLGIMAMYLDYHGSSNVFVIIYSIIGIFTIYIISLVLSKLFVKSDY